MGLVHGEKTSFFLNPKKPRVTQSRIRNSTKDKKKSYKKIIEELFDFYKNLFPENLNLFKSETKFKINFYYTGNRRLI